MITAETYARALFEAVSETHPKDHDKVLDNFVRVLAANGDVAKYGEIERLFSKLEAESRGVKQAELTTARDVRLDKATVEKLNELAGSKLEIKHEVDDRIIGGVVLRVDDTLLDASIKRNLDTLKQALSGEQQA